MPIKTPFDYQTTRVAVCFHGAVHHPWQRLLKKNFCHCFLLIEQAQGICLVDALAPHFKLVLFPKQLSFMQLINHYQEQGCIILYQDAMPKNTPRQPNQARVRRVVPSLAIYSCVSLIKSFLNLQVFFLITPWQLYKTITAGRLGKWRQATKHNYIGL